jgi:hypothetical protein
MLRAGQQRHNIIPNGNLRGRQVQYGDGDLHGRPQSDEQAIDVLRNCAEAMTDGGRVLAVEMTMPSDNRPSFARVMDLQMMLLFDGGRIRTEDELCGVFGAAGLEVVRVLSAPPSPNVVIEGRRL